MPEELEDESKRSLDFQHYLDIARRRHMWFLVPLLFGWALVWGLSWILPSRYKSVTTILVEQPTMPKNYVLPNISDDLQDRLQSIQQQILSRTRLLMIINEFHLYRDKRKPLSADAEVNRMRNDIDIELIRDPQNQITAFNVSYEAPDPRTAQLVTGELTHLFINENLKQREQESRNTTDFLEQQLVDAGANLAAQEAKIQEYESAHAGELPSQQTSNLQILSGLQQQLQSEQDALNTAKQQRVYYESLVEQYRSFQPAASTHGADATPTGLGALDAQLQKMKDQLADLRTRYTERYPAVRSLEAEIARTQQLRNSTAAALSKSARSSQAAAAAPVQAQNQDSPLVPLQGQLKANQIEIANREQAIAALTARISQYQGRLNATPESQQQLANLTRNYDQSKAYYDDLLKKKNESSMATSMEQMQQGERFILLDPPSLPIKPDFPNRLKFCLMGLIAGILLGGGLVATLEILDDRLRSDRDIEELLPIPVISEIPEVVNPADERNRRKRAVVGWVAAAVVFLIILAGSAVSYLHA